MVPGELASPGGMTIDAGGKLWVAHWGAGAVCRWGTRALLRGRVTFAGSPPKAAMSSSGANTSRTSS